MPTYFRSAGNRATNEPAKSAALRDALIRQLAAAVGPDLATMPRIEDADLPRHEALKRLRGAGVDAAHRDVLALTDAQLNDLVRQHEAAVAAGLRLPNGAPLPRTATGLPTDTPVRGWATTFTQPTTDGLRRIDQKYPGGHVKTFSATATAGDRVRAAADQARRLRQ